MPSLAPPQRTNEVRGDLKGPSTSAATVAIDTIWAFDISAASITATLPSAPIDKSRVYIYISGFTPGGGFALTVTCGGADTFAAGGTSIKRDRALGQSAWLQYDLASGKWYELPERTPLSMIHNLPANLQVASYTAVLGDFGKVVEMNVASANTFTVPPHSSVAFNVGDTMEVCQVGAGITTITPGAGVTIHFPGARNKTAEQWASVTLRCRATDEWVAAGDLST